MKLIAFDCSTRRCSLRNCRIEVDYSDVCQVGGHFTECTSPSFHYKYANARVLDRVLPPPPPPRTTKQKGTFYLIYYSRLKKKKKKKKIDEYLSKILYVSDVSE